MDRSKRRIFPLHFSPGKKLFHIVVKLSDAPGSYGAILSLLGSKVNLIGTTTYTRSDGTAVFSGFSESLSSKQTAKDLEELIMSSKAAIAADVVGDKDGLLVDTFHTGVIADGEEYLLIRRQGLSNMFNQVARLLGSGGEALLYEEGRSLGQKNVENLVSVLGKERVRKESTSLAQFLTAQGWGMVETVGDPDSGKVTLKVTDCFECDGEVRSRKGCNFMRGYFAGAAESIYDGKIDSKETACITKGAPSCEFLLTARK